MFRSLARGLMLAGAIGLTLGSPDPAQAQQQDVPADFDTARLCAVSTLVISGLSPAYSELVDKASALSGRSRTDLEADFEGGATNLRRSLFQRTLAKSDVLDFAINLCPGKFGTRVPQPTLDPAPPIADADRPAYAFVLGKVWNCRADIPETLDRDSETHPYRLRFSMGLDPNLRLFGSLEAYEDGQDKPFARYPLTGWPYRSSYSPELVAELGQPESANGLPDYGNWHSFRLNIGIPRSDSGEGYRLSAQIDRRSDRATYVNLTGCYFE